MLLPKFEFTKKEHRVWEDKRTGDYKAYGQFTTGQQIEHARMLNGRHSQLTHKAFSLMSSAGAAPIKISDTEELALTRSTSSSLEHPAIVLAHWALSYLDGKDVDIRVRTLAVFGERVDPGRDAQSHGLEGVGVSARLGAVFGVIAAHSVEGVRRDYIPYEDDLRLLEGLLDDFKPAEPNSQIVDTFAPEGQLL